MRAMEGRVGACPRLVATSAQVLLRSLGNAKVRRQPPHFRQQHSAGLGASIMPNTARLVLTCSRRLAQSVLNFQQDEAAGKHESSCERCSTSTLPWAAGPSTLPPLRCPHYVSQPPPLCAAAAVRCCRAMRASPEAELQGRGGGGGGSRGSGGWEAAAGCLA